MQGVQNFGKTKQVFGTLDEILGLTGFATFNHKVMKCNFYLTLNASFTYMALKEWVF